MRLQTNPAPNPQSKKFGCLSSSFLFGRGEFHPQTKGSPELNSSMWDSWRWGLSPPGLAVSRARPQVPGPFNLTNWTFRGPMQAARPPPLPLVPSPRHEQRGRISHLAGGAALFESVPESCPANRCRRWLRWRDEHECTAEVRTQRYALQLITRTPYNCLAHQNRVVLMYPCCFTKPCCGKDILLYNYKYSYHIAPFYATSHDNSVVYNTAPLGYRISFWPNHNLSTLQT